MRTSYYRSCYCANCNKYFNGVICKCKNSFLTREKIEKAMESIQKKMNSNEYSFKIGDNYERNDNVSESIESNEARV